MEKIIIIALAFMLAISIFSPKRKKEKNKETPKEKLDKMPYKQKFILTKNEYAFWIELEKVAVDMKWKVCPKVGLKELFEITSKENYMNYFGRISQKHIDFLICNEKLQPVYAIELDDNSHKGREESDRFKDEIFKLSSIPLIRIKAQKDYSKEYILRNIANKTLNKQCAPLNQGVQGSNP